MLVACISMELDGRERIQGDHVALISESFVLRTIWIFNYITARM